MRNALLLLMISCSLLGVADAGFISWQKLSGYTPRCTSAFKCEQVLNSKWANVGPLPLSVLGIMFYAIFLSLAITIYLDKTQLKIGNKLMSLPKISFIWGVVGALFSLYLVTVMGVILNAWCLYCLISAVNCLILFTLSGGNLKLSQKANVL